MFQDREVLIPSWASIRFGLNSSVPAGVLYWQQQHNNSVKSQLCNGRGNNTRSVLTIQLRDILTQLLHITWVVLCYTCNLNQAVGNEPANGRTSILLFPVQNCPIKISWTDFDLSSFDEFVVKECSLCVDGFVSAGHVAKQKHEAAGHLSFTETLGRHQHCIVLHQDTHTATQRQYHSTHSPLQLHKWHNTHSY